MLLPRAEPTESMDHAKAIMSPTEIHSVNGHDLTMMEKEITFPFCLIFISLLKIVWFWN